MLSHSSLTHCLTCYRIWDRYFLSTLCSYHLTIFWLLLFLKSAVSVIVLFCCGLVFLSGDFITMCRVSLSYLRSILLEHKSFCLFCHYAWELPLSHSLISSSYWMFVGLCHSVVLDFCTFIFSNSWSLCTAFWVIFQIINSYFTCV